MAIKVEQQLCACPTSHRLNPFQVRPPRHVQAREGVTQTVRAKAATWFEHFPRDFAEYSVAKVVGVNEAAGLIREHQRLGLPALTGPGLELVYAASWFMGNSSPGTLISGAGLIAENW